MTHAPRILAALVLLIALALPVYAAPVPTGIFADADILEIDATMVSDYTVPPGMAIGSIVFEMSRDTNIQYTMYYGTGSSVFGDLEYNTVGLWGTDYGYESRAYVSMGDGVTESTCEYTFVDTPQGAIKRMAVTGHARDDVTNTSGFAAWDTSILDFYTAQNIAYYQVDNVEVKPIYRIAFTSDNPVKVTISYGDQKYIQSNAVKTGTDIIAEWLRFVGDIAGTIYDVVTSAFRWIKFFFVDNLGMTISLYIAGSLAIAARRSRGNPITVLRQFFKDQKNLFEFIMNLWERLVNIVATFRGIFRI